MGRFFLNTDSVNKVVSIILEGTFSNEDGLKSIQAYQQTVNPITPTDYALQIDCRKLNVAAPDVVPMMQNYFTMFKSDGFKSVSLAIVNNPIVKMQLARIGRKAGLENMEITTSFPD